MLWIGFVPSFAGCGRDGLPTWNQGPGHRWTDLRVLEPSDVVYRNRGGMRLPPGEGPMTKRQAGSAESERPGTGFDEAGDVGAL